MTVFEMSGTAGNGQPHWMEGETNRQTISSDQSAFSQTREQLEKISRAHGGRIVRKYFVFLLPPPNGQTDLVWGSWWFIYGSVLQALIPIAPLMSLFEGWWEDHSRYLPLDIHVWMYVLQIIVGILFTIGSYAFLRAVHPQHSTTPFFNPTHAHAATLTYPRKCCMTDELWGMWCFWLGIACGIPIFSFFVHYSAGASGGFWELILLVNLVLVLMMTYGVRIAWPSGSEESNKQIISPYFLWVFGRCKVIADHVANDMLIMSWGMYFSCIVGLIGCLGLLALAVKHNHQREIYDYAANTVDMVFFTVGALYFTAGWYVVQPESDVDPLTPDNSSSPRIQDSPTARAKGLSSVGGDSAVVGAVVGSAKSAGMV